MNIKTILIVGFLNFFVGPTQATTLLLDIIDNEPVNSASGIIRPNKGATMTQVTNDCGEPKLKHHAVGKPPISRWDYKKYSVYFENEFVIHSVVNKPDSAKKSP